MQPIVTHAEEIIRIPIETRHLRSIRREERVHLVRPVAAVVHVPRLASDADGLRDGRWVALRVVGVRDRAGAVVGHPDHDLVLVRATGGGGGEDVVGDVDDGVGGEVGEGPGPGGLKKHQRSALVLQ